jgi:S1-C subfamily serine protease
MSASAFRSSAPLLVLLAALALAHAAPSASAQPVLDATTRNGLPSLAPMLDRITPAVVNIATVSTAPIENNPLARDPFFRRFFNLPDKPQQQVAAGSGVIVDAARGLVLTNNHVVREAQQIIVTLKDRRQFQAQLVGTDPGTDIAVLRIDAKNLTALAFGDSDNHAVGDYVIAIGNPFGIGQTVTSGIISAVGRTGLTPEGYEDFIQTDASINPGNSGGALVNLRGELIGINTAIIGPSGGNVGIGFAVPSNMVRQVVAQIVKYGEVRRGRLGVDIEDLTPAAAEKLRLSFTEGAILARASGLARRKGRLPQWRCRDGIQRACDQERQRPAQPPGAHPGGRGGRDDDRARRPRAESARADQRARVGARVGRNRAAARGAAGGQSRQRAGGRRDDRGQRQPRRRHRSAPRRCHRRGRAPPRAQRRRIPRRAERDTGPGTVRRDGAARRHADDLRHPLSGGRAYAASAASRMPVNGQRSCG